MFGDGIGKLNIYRRLSGRPIPELLWSKSGDQDNIWRQSKVTLNQQLGSNYTILVEGVRGRNDRG